MRVQQVMQTGVARATPEESARACAWAMARTGAELVPVVDPAGRLLGLVTDRDLAVRVLAAGLSAEVPLGSVMSREALLTCRPEEPLEEVAARLARAGLARAPVLDRDGRYLGLLGLGGLARAQGAEALGALLRELGRGELFAARR